MKYLIALFLPWLLFSCRKDDLSCPKDHTHSIVGNYEGQREILNDNYTQPIWMYNPSIEYTADSSLWMDGWSGWSGWVDTVYLILDCQNIVVPEQNFTGTQYSAGGYPYHHFDFDIKGHGYIDSDSIFIKIQSQSNKGNFKPQYSEISIKKV